MTLLYMVHKFLQCNHDITELTRENSTLSSACSWKSKLERRRQVRTQVGYYIIILHSTSLSKEGKSERGKKLWKWANKASIIFSDFLFPIFLSALMTELFLSFFAVRLMLYLYQVIHGWNSLNQNKTLTNKVNSTVIASAVCGIMFQGKGLSGIPGILFGKSLLIKCLSSDLSAEVEFF